MPLLTSALRSNGAAPARVKPAVDVKSGRTIVEIDPSHYRPAEVDALVGAPDKAAAELGWRAQVMLPELVAMMAQTDDRRVRDGKPLN